MFLIWYIITTLCEQMSRFSCAAVYHKSILLSLSTVLQRAEHQAAPPHSTEQTTDLK